MRAIGGPHNGKWFDVPPGTTAYALPVPRPLRSFSPPADLFAFGEDPELVFYTVERLVWPGYRFPLRVLVAPGVKIQGHPEPYDSSWPNPLVPASCRCEKLAWTVALGRTASACHLDHCPLHGLWKFPPMTPMWVSVTTRAEWLAEHAAQPGPKALPSQPHTP
jgi:hypothetical protein